MPISTAVHPICNYDKSLSFDEYIRIYAMTTGVNHEVLPGELKHPMRSVWNSQKTKKGPRSGLVFLHPHNRAGYRYSGGVSRVHSHNEM